MRSADAHARTDEQTRMLIDNLVRPRSWPAMLIPTPRELNKNARERNSTFEKELKEAQAVRQKIVELEKELKKLREKNALLDAMIDITLSLQRAAREGKKTIVVKRWRLDELSRQQIMGWLGGVKSILRREDLPPLYQRIYRALEEKGYRVEVRNDKNSTPIVYLMKASWN